MHIFIRLHGRELIQIQASFAETVSSVLMRVIDISSNVMDDSYFAEKDYLRQLSISYGGKTLMPLRTLEESNIQKDGVLSISNTLLGGMMAVQIAYRRAQEARVQQPKAQKSAMIRAMAEIVYDDRVSGSKIGFGKSIQLEEEAEQFEEKFQRHPPQPTETANNVLTRVKYLYEKLAWWVHSKITSRSAFEVFIMINILAVAVTTGLSLNGEDANNLSLAKGIRHTTNITFYVFIVEAALKFVSFGVKPHHFFIAPHGEGAFNSFDMLLVVMSLALIGEKSGGSIKILRLIRIVRLLSIIKNVPELKVIVGGLIAGLKSVVYIVLLLVLVIYLFAVLGVMTFAENDPANFGTITISMMTLFEAGTLSGWSKIALTQWDGCDSYLEGDYSIVAAGSKAGTVKTITGSMLTWECGRPARFPLFTFIYFLAFTVLAAMVIMSLFIGVITMAMFDSYQHAKEEKEQRDYAMHLEKAEKDLLTVNSKLADTIDRAMQTTRPMLRKSSSEIVFENNKGVDCLRDNYRALALTMRSTAKSSWFNNTITVFIVIAGVTIGLSTDNIGNQGVLSLVNFACLIVFTGEVIVKLIACDQHPSRYLKDSWNRFDALIVLNGWLEFIGISFDGLAALRLLRLLKVFRLVKALPRLRSIVESLFSGFASVVWVVVLMAIFNFIMASLGMILFQKIDPFRYGSLLSALFTTFQIETLDAWPDIWRISMYGCGVYPSGYPEARSMKRFDCDPEVQGLGWFSALYMIVVVVFGGLILPTMLVGIVAVSFEESYRRLEAEIDSALFGRELIEYAIEENPMFFTPVRLRLLRDIFDSIDIDGGGTLDQDEVTPLMQYLLSRHMNTKLKLFEVQALIQKFDVDNSSDVNFGEFVHIIRVLIKTARSGDNKKFDVSEGNGRVVFDRSTEPEPASTSSAEVMDGNLEGVKDLTDETTMQNMKPSEIFKLCADPYPDMFSRKWGKLEWEPGRGVPYQTEPMENLNPPHSTQLIKIEELKNKVMKYRSALRDLVSSKEEECMQHRKEHLQDQRKEEKSETGLEQASPSVITLQDVNRFSVVVGGSCNDTNGAMVSGSDTASKSQRQILPSMSVSVPEPKILPPGKEGLHEQRHFFVMKSINDEEASL